MGVSAAKFESAGQISEHYIPGAYSRRNTVGAGNGVSAGNLAIIGPSTSGEPNVLHCVTDKAEAKDLLGSGDLLDAVSHAFNGSSDFVPSKVYCMRVGKVTQSYRYFYNSNSYDTVTTTVIDEETEEETSVSSNELVPVLKVNSSDYGSQANQMKMYLRKDGDSTYKVTASYKGNDITVSDIGRQSIQISYIKDDYDIVQNNISAVQCKVDSTGITLSTLSTNEEGESSTNIDPLSITWDECPTLAELVNKINDSGVWAATLLDSRDDVSTSELDCVSKSYSFKVSTNEEEEDDDDDDDDDEEIDVEEGYDSPYTVTNTGPITLTSNLQALIEALESIQYVESVEFTGNERYMPDVDDGYVYFEGGSSGSDTIEDYNDALELLEKEDIQIIATPSTNLDVHTLISDHCTTMSTVSKKKERTFWVGLPSGTSIDEGVTAAKSLNTELGSLVITGANAADPLTGSAVDINPALLACKCAGIEAAIAISNPLTNKVLKVNSFSTKYNDSELEKMIQNGIVPFGENEDGNLVCIRSLTTYQSNSLIQNERSMTRAVLYMDRDLRQAYSRRIGTVSEPSESDILNVLENKAKEWYTNNLITRSDSGDLVFNKKVTFSGDKTYVTFERYIRAPNNFVFITGTNQIYSSTVEV